MGRCTECGNWNSFVEELAPEDESAKKGFAARLAAVTSAAKWPQWFKRPNGTYKSGQANKALPLSQIDTDESGRLETGMAGLDEVLGGGLMPGSVILIAGDPWCGQVDLAHAGSKKSLPHPSNSLHYWRRVCCSSKS
jgi:DNA repair protein RadA/Sms